MDRKWRGTITNIEPEGFSGEEKKKFEGLPENFFDPRLNPEGLYLCIPPKNKYWTTFHWGLNVVIEVGPCKTPYKILNWNGRNSTQTVGIQQLHLPFSGIQKNPIFWTLKLLHTEKYMVLSVPYLVIVPIFTAIFLQTFFQKSQISTYGWTYTDTFFKNKTVNPKKSILYRVMFLFLYH